MSETLPSRKKALQLLHEKNCSKKVINHCVAVADLALEVASSLRAKGMKIDFELVEIGALLHDIGRSRTHTIQHVIVGVEIAKSAGLSDPVISIIKRHVGGGISNTEADKLGWPKDIYLPITLEEKIVCYSDKLIENGKRVPIDITIKKLTEEMKFEAAERVRRLYDEIKGLIGDSP